MRLDAHEFIRRFLLHVLPSGFQRIRHDGLLANRYREVKLNQCRDLLAALAPVVVPLDTQDYRDRYQRLSVGPAESLHDRPDGHIRQLAWRSGGSSMRQVVQRLRPYVLG